MASLRYMVIFSSLFGQALCQGHLRKDAQVVKFGVLAGDEKQLATLLRGMFNATRTHAAQAEVPLKADTQTVLKFSKLLKSRSEHKAVGEGHEDEKQPLFDNGPATSEDLGEEEQIGSLAENKQKKKDEAEVPSAAENPKCDQACTNGSMEDREECTKQCVVLQEKICITGFTCTAGCGNNVKQMKKDPECEVLCDSVHAAVCYPFHFEASSKDVSPHHDDKPPPSIEATPAPRVFEGKTLFCNLYPSSRYFEVLVMSSPADKDGDAVTRLTYKQCDEIALKTGDVIGVRAGGAMSGVSKPILKIPSIMLFGQWAHGNHQVNFNRYYAKSDGPFVCNGFPVWEKEDDNVGAEIQVFRDGETPLSKLRYKECTPTSVHNGEVISSSIAGKNAGSYTIAGSPRVVVLGKAGETTALAYEAWSVGDLQQQDE